MSISDRAEVIHEVYGKQGTVRRAGITEAATAVDTGQIFYRKITKSAAKYKTINTICTLIASHYRNRSNPVRQNQS